MMGTQIGEGIISMRRLLTITAALILFGISLQWQVEAQGRAAGTSIFG
jgi:hypothetical protein